MLTINSKANGYRGIWYMNQPSNDEYVYKYSGGLGTYPANHQPFAIYCADVNRTFFCYGGTTETSDTELVHMISYYDHSRGIVPKPTLLLNKETSDAHDNPVISVDQNGHIWIFSTSHGLSRPSYVHRSLRPYAIDEFERVDAVYMSDGEIKALDNFSYMQVWPVARGFLSFFTKYKYPANRTTCFMSSPDGVHWSGWQRLGAIDQGHYQTSALGRGRAGTAFNYHPAELGLNYRTNLYYVETTDGGTTWRAADATRLTMPLVDVKNDALVRDYEAEGLKVYINDVNYDDMDRPVILFVTSKGYEAGPKNGPRTWTIAHWRGSQWVFHQAMASDNNYDMGSLYIEGDGTWRIIGPTELGPQPYNPGGEVAMWTSVDMGARWTKVRQMTQGSPRNHTFVRRPVNAHPDFYAFWADGHARQPSESRLYFCDKEGNVRRLPRQMDKEFAEPEVVPGRRFS